jgi:hypothetical protein
MSQENVELVRDMLDAFNRDDLEAASYEEAARLSSPPRCQTVACWASGGTRAFASGWTTCAEPLRLSSSQGLHDHGRPMLCELVSRGLGQASGVPIEWTTFAVIRIRTGKIAQVRVFLSREQALEAVGLRE